LEELEMKKKKEVKIEVEEHVFIGNIRTQIDLMSKAILEIENQIRTFQDLYLKISSEKIYYNLKYYVVGDGLQYERIGKRKIGFIKEE